MDDKRIAAGITKSSAYVFNLLYGNKPQDIDAILLSDEDLAKLEKRTPSSLIKPIDPVPDEKGVEDIDELLLSIPDGEINKEIRLTSNPDIHELMKLPDDPSVKKQQTPVGSTRRIKNLSIAGKHPLLCLYCICLYCVNLSRVYSMLRFSCIVLNDPIIFGDITFPQLTS